ncbi:hypothetical protein T8J41_08325 [Nitratireductor rhodophyticola]|uniref:hypothetical protein n=1 Tax=Nitratireductor rhodophyticola TaxID=2854036 RepID=UPI0008141B73|nr:hypothetical protein [Nitratireductor rhodophyticola]WPZ15790.1 hypothetical protein T8J41_08325 [Nitratireductor rhodophyticola]
MQDENHKKKPQHRSAGSEGTRGFVIGAVGAAIVILAFMAISGSGFFGEDVTGTSGTVSDSVPMGDGG